MFPWLFYMDTTFPFYVGFVDGASILSSNIASPVWIIYSLSHEFIHIYGRFVGIATNKHTEYNGVIDLLDTSLHLGICHLDVFLASQLLVSQLNNCYRVCNPYLFIKFLLTRNLVRHFESISFMHVPRNITSDFL